MNYRLALLFVVAGCSTQAGPATPDPTVTLTAPKVVTGVWQVIDASHVLSCAYDLVATVSGGQEGRDAIEWSNAAITLDAPPALAAVQPYKPSYVAQWFGGSKLLSGTSATGHMREGRDRPFTAQHALRYTTPRGTTSVATTNVQCLAP
jgi:hypothetical protein